MTGAQFVFLAAFTVVNVVIIWAVGVVVVGARRVDGGRRFSRAMLKRLGRLPAERSEANRWAFYAHRVSGIGIFAFVFLHIFDVSLYAASSSLYDNVHRLYGSAAMRLFECGLLLALLFHALNGLRVVAIDVWDLDARHASRLLAGVVVVTVVLTVAGSAVILQPLMD